MPARPGAQTRAPATTHASAAPCPASMGKSIFQTGPLRVAGTSPCAAPMPAMASQGHSASTAVPRQALAWQQPPAVAPEACAGTASGDGAGWKGAAPS